MQSKIQKLREDWPPQLQSNFTRPLALHSNLQDAMKDLKSSLCQEEAMKFVAPSKAPANGSTHDKAVESPEPGSLDPDDFEAGSELEAQDSEGDAGEEKEEENAAD